MPTRHTHIICTYLHFKYILNLKCFHCDVLSVYYVRRVRDEAACASDIDALSLYVIYLSSIPVYIQIQITQISLAFIIIFIVFKRHIHMIACAETQCAHFSVGLLHVFSLVRRAYTIFTILIYHSASIWEALLLFLLVYFYLSLSLSIRHFPSCYRDGHVRPCKYCTYIKLVTSHKTHADRAKKAVCVYCGINVYPHPSYLYFSSVQANKFLPFVQSTMCIVKENWMNSSSGNNKGIRRKTKKKK